MPDILASAQIQLEDCAEELTSDRINVHKVAQTGKEAESALRDLQMVTSSFAPGMKARTDEITEELHGVVDRLVEEGPLNSQQAEAPTEAVEKLRALVEEALVVAEETRDDDFDLEEAREQTTASERFEKIGRAAYDHPDLMEEPLEELFRRESNLEPPYGRLS